MKKNVKKLLIGILASAMTVFALLASGCSAQEKLDTWYEQLICEHTKVEKVLEKAPTCTEDGYTEHEVCKSCEKEIGKKVIKATGHENITVIEGYAATCTTTGKTDGKYCNDCKKTVVEQKTIYALGHKRTYAKAEEVTCTTDGHTSGWICGREDCDYVYSGYELFPATGHDLDENGDCENCGKEYAVISLADVGVGMDLSGYKIEIAVTEEEFSAWNTEIGGSAMANYMMFGDARLEFAFDSVTYHKNFTEDSGDYIFVYTIYGSYPEVGTPFVLPSGSVITDFETLSEASMGTQFKFVYVGLPETDNVATPAATNDVETTAVSYAMNKRAMPAVEELQYGLFVTDKNSDGWTDIY